MFNLKNHLECKSYRFCNKNQKQFGKCTVKHPVQYNILHQLTLASQKNFSSPITIGFEYFRIMLIQGFMVLII